MLITALIILAALVNYCFSYKPAQQDWLTWVNKCLNQAYDATGDAKLKKWELTVTTDAFIRLRKTYDKGKRDYYSFNLRQLNDMAYLGNTNNGMLQFKTIADDIIVQTYNNRHGDVDSMATVLNLPVKNMEPERLDSLREAFDYLKAKK